MPSNLKFHRSSRFLVVTGVGITLLSGAALPIFTAAARADAPAQNAPEKRFQIGDEVEMFVAGDATHGVIAGGYQDSGFGYGKYLIRLPNGDKQDCNAKFVHSRFQPDSTTRFDVGASVEVRRWDGSLYKGKVIGADGDRYNVSYQSNGAATSEWFQVNNVREADAGQPEHKKENQDRQNDNDKNNDLQRGWPGQEYQVGDRVQYNDPGFTDIPTLGIIISVNAQKRLYQIRDEKDASVRYDHPCYAVLKPGEKIDNSFYIGKWQVYTTGAAGSTIIAPIRLAPLEIKADGTYLWQQDNGKTFRGRWTARRGVRGVKLLKGPDQTDWTVYEKTEAFATTAKTRDEIGLNAGGAHAGFNAFRIGANRSCILKGRFDAGN